MSFVDMWRRGEKQFIEVFPCNTTAMARVTFAYSGECIAIEKIK